MARLRLALFLAVHRVAAAPAATCSTVDFAAHGPYHPVVILPADYHVHDFSNSKGEELPDGSWSVGKYDEVRPMLYDQEMFSDAAKAVDGFSGVRDVHVGLDIGGPVGTEVLAWAPGVVVHSGFNPSDGDYGHVIVTEHRVGDSPVYSLYGHLAPSSLALAPIGHAFDAGAVLGHIGARGDNGGWAPHLHFQLSLARPATHDLPGVVSRVDRAAATALYPDPRLVLGPLYA